MQCGNLRRAGTSSRLVAAGRPSRNGRLTSLPLLTWSDGNEGRVALTRSGNRLRITYLDTDNPGYDAGGVSGVTKTALKISRDVIVVMTDVDSYRLTLNSAGKWSLRPDVTYPAMQFVATDEMRLSADVDGRALTGSYTGHSISLNAADTRNLGDDLMGGYAELVDRATRGGMELQPLLARYRLEGEHGETLYRSPAVLVGASSGVQCLNELRCELEENNTRRGTLRIAADVYRLTLRQLTVADAAKGEVRRLVVETSLPVHPVDGGVGAANMLGRSGTGGVLLRCFLPGASVTMVPARGHVARKLQRLAMKGDIAFQEAAVITNPFDGNAPLEVRVPVNRGAVQGLTDEISAVDRLLSTKVATVSPLTAKCLAPNRFVAATGCVTGEHVAWGDITVKGFCGYRVEEMTADTTAEGVASTWRCVVVTELESGERRVATSWGTERAPLKLSPLLWYPRADAVSMTVTLERDGALYRGVFPLIPDESRTASFYFHPDCAKITLEPAEGSFVYVSDGGTHEEFPAGIVTASAADPLQGIGSGAASTGRIMVLMNVDRRGSSWEFGDARVYALTTAGIYLCALNNAGSRLRCRRIDGRCVTARGAAAHTDDDRYAVMCIASGDLVGLQRGNAVTLRRNAGGEILGWDGRFKELWICDKEGNVSIPVTAGGGWRTLEGLPVVALHATGAGLLADTELGVRDTALPVTGMTEFTYRLRLYMPATRWYASRSEVTGVAAEIYSGNINGAISVTSRTMLGDDEAAKVAQMSFSGAVNTPLVLGLHGFHGPVLDIEIRGEMSTGSEIAALGLKICQGN